MKKSILAAALAATMLLTGCSNVSNYDSTSVSSDQNGISSKSTSNVSTSSSIKSSSQLSESSIINSTSSKPQTNTSTDEYKKDIFTVGAKKCGDWYYKQTETGSIDAVLYVDDYSKLNDPDEFVKNFHTGLYNIIINEPHKGFYTYWVLKENGSLVTTTFNISNVKMPIVWMGDYEPLNNNELAKQFNDIWCDNISDTSNSSSSTSTTSQVPPNHNEDVLITTAKTLDDKVCAFITNNGTKTIDELDVQIIYKDSSGNIVDTDRDGHDMILPNQTVVSRFNAPKSFDTYEVEHTEEYGVNPTYKNHLEQCEVKSNLGEKCVIVQITNNSNVEIEEFEYIVVFYKGDDIASVSYPKDVYHIAPNKTATEKVSTYSLDFDRFEVYVNQAHTFR